MKCVAGVHIHFFHTCLYKDMAKDADSTLFRVHACIGAAYMYVIDRE